MTATFRKTIVLFLSVAVAACESVPTSQPYAADPSMGLIVARDYCSECHNTGGGGDSPNERAPAFREIVNRPGMTPETLATWLKDGHNYPVEMGFHLEPQQVDALVAYMIRWRTDGAPPGS